MVGFRTSGDVTSRRFADGEICLVHDGSPSGGETVDVVCYLGGPTHACYVYVNLPGYGRTLTLCEVEVYQFTGKRNQGLRTCSIQKWTHFQNLNCAIYDVYFWYLDVSTFPHIKSFDKNNHAYGTPPDHHIKCMTIIGRLSSHPMS